MTPTPPTPRVDFVEAFDNLVADSAQPTGAPSCCDSSVLQVGGGLIYQRQLVAQFYRLCTCEKITKVTSGDTWHMARAQAASQAVASTRPSLTTLQGAAAPFASADDALDVGSDFANGFSLHYEQLGVVAWARRGDLPGWPRHSSRSGPRDALCSLGFNKLCSWWRRGTRLPCTVLARLCAGHDQLKLKHSLCSPRLADATPGVYRLAGAADQIASMDDALRPEQAGLARAVGEARAAEGLRLEQQAAWAPPVEEAEAAPSRYRDAVAARHGMARVRQLQGADGRRTPPPYGSRNQSDMGTEGPCWPPASRSMAQGTPMDLPYLKVEWSGHESNEVYNSFAQTCFRGRA